MLNERCPFFLTLADLDLKGQRVIIREDFNVPIDHQRVTHTERIERAVPTIQQVLSAGARVLLLSHWGRPTEGHVEAEYSLAPVAEVLSQLLGQAVPLVTDWLDGVSIEPGQVVLAENVRFLRGEKNNELNLARRMAKQCDIFVMDAFATAHRAQASTAGLAEHAPIACAGPLLMAELEALSYALDRPKKPVVAVVGGSKVSTKIALLENLLPKVEVLIVGGGLANTFLKAQGYPIGQSLYEPAWLPQAQAFWAAVEAHQVKMPLPQDVVVASSLSGESTIKSIDAVSQEDNIFDMGPQTSAYYADLIQNAATIVWNGPVGVFEKPPFSHGTAKLVQSIAESSAYVIAGGGDTLSALAKFGASDAISYVSTGGGAFLEFMAGKVLPALAILERRARL